MKKIILASAILAAGLTLPAFAGNVDGGAVVGGAVGGGTGAAVGSAIGGRDGAIIGGAIGGATGAAIGSSARKQPEKVVVKERVVKEVVYVDDDRDGPPGHRHGKKKGWKKHKHHDD